jgi:hypothetical protein
MGEEEQDIERLKWEIRIIGKSNPGAVFERTKQMLDRIRAMDDWKEAAKLFGVDPKGTTERKFKLRLSRANKVLAKKLSFYTGEEPVVKKKKRRSRKKQFK